MKKLNRPPVPASDLPLAPPHGWIIALTPVLMAISLTFLFGSIWTALQPQLADHLLLPSLGIAALLCFILLVHSTFMLTRARSWCIPTLTGLASLTVVLYPVTIIYLFLHDALNAGGIEITGLSAALLALVIYRSRRMQAFYQYYQRAWEILRQTGKTISGPGH
ncbi:hypothetical protein QCD60_14505 [Pokkaliibacter sp. MBI-7]|uniref:hypothetical protein n=1 Tax=Pokkaliibacter sp. MBI-7 TaxID=3040600 RepID=UPI002449F517|nr:hypothetical protein [Pokkaliibacter sp. MBI-7]MDH2433781.1 hypothetical protein [Pokkaliibacter sp. MBI-7]